MAGQNREARRVASAAFASLLKIPHRKLRGGGIRRRCVRESTARLRLSIADICETFENSMLPSDVSLRNFLFTGSCATCNLVHGRAYLEHEAIVRIIVIVNPANRRLQVSSDIVTW